MSEATAGNLRNRRILAGIIGGAIGRSAALLAPFIVMPVLLKHLGHTNFGVWMTALSITSMSMFVDLGVGNGLLTKLSSAYGRQDFSEMRGLISSAYAALIAISASLLGVLGLALLILYSGPFHWAGGEGASPAVWIAVVCLATFLAGVPASLIQKVFYACQLVWLSNVWQVAGAIFSVLACLGAIQLGWGFWQVIAAYSVPPVIMMIVAAMWFFRRQPELTPRLREVSTENVRKLLAIGARFLLLGVATSIALNVDNVIIANKLGPAVVTEYAVPAKLASVLGLMVTTLFLPLWPANAEALVRGDFAWIRRSTRLMSLVGGGSVAVVGVGLVIFSNTIMSLWMGTTFRDQHLVLGFLVTTFILMAVTSPSQMLLNSAGSLKVQIYGWIAFLTFTLLAKILLVENQRLWIVPLISAIGYLVILFPIMWWSARRILIGAGR